MKGWRFAAFLQGCVCFSSDAAHAEGSTIVRHCKGKKRRGGRVVEPSLQRVCLRTALAGAQMYSRGREGLRNLDMALEALRQGALKESRATSVEMRRYMIREDVRRQNQQPQRKQQEQQQRLQGGEGQQASSSALSVSVHGSPTESGALSTSRSVGAGGNDKTSGTAKAEGLLPVWYDGYCPTPPGTVEQEPKRRATTAACNEAECGAAGRIGNGEEIDMVVDVSQRVSQAERTLYPVLLAEVAECATTDARNNGGIELGVGSSEVIEWDERGAPVRLRSLWHPASPRGLLPVPGVADEKRESVTGGVALSGRTSAMKTETTAQIPEFGTKLSVHPHGYARQGHLWTSTPITVNPAQKGVSPSRRGDSRDTRAKGLMNNTRQMMPNSRDPSNGTRGRSRPPLSTEGTAVAESSASAIARRIRRAVVKECMALVESDKNGVQSGSCSPPSLDLGLGGRCSVVYEPENVECLVAQVVHPVAAFFCTSCGACSARDVVTGDPNTCAACGEPFEELPPPPQHACLMDTVVTENRNSAASQAAGVAVGPPVSVKKKCAATTSTMATTTTTTTKEATRDTTNACTGTTPTVTKVAAGTQAGPSCSMPRLAVTAVQGVYFMHLWDLATAARNK
ncbi:hypothetical protein TraAM80_07857 [Trypanosoma rangeli]|uniref:Uncharacterized protein n=1 Tax=Trypanosoma rangeli TaxID=5698 RepID=A0A422N3H6_TRYRA|nr:uncharacterized protein TraAM80_07857 [Trypanosoma rangeli]RNF00039.1 hypothetical protein TraAM80_07857 [Trypanosoma rangeli]|eukprot:RNF00039.1 hypothetical protein TraAM80_07857 [Trypanosoma rangeli]